MSDDTIRADGDVYDEDYFLHGKHSGKSLYENYRWMPRLTTKMVASIISHLGIKPDESILDFGCARGYTVKAFREMGYNAWGYDISRWALQNADEAVKDRLILNESTLLGDSFDWIVAKDVLEHVTTLSRTTSTLLGIARRGIFAVVPLASNGAKYDVPDYEKDITHIHRKPLDWWVSQFMRPGWSVESRYRVPGVKDNYKYHLTGNGFITARRIDP